MKTIQILRVMICLIEKYSEIQPSNLVLQEYQAKFQKYLFSLHFVRIYFFVYIKARHKHFQSIKSFDYTLRSEKKMYHKIHFLAMTSS